MMNFERTKQQNTQATTLGAVHTHTHTHTHTRIRIDEKNCTIIRGSHISLLNTHLSNAISLIALIITIIVIIILAAVVLGSALKTPEQANYARFVSDISTLQEQVKIKYTTRYSELALRGATVTDSSIYKWLATGDSDAISGLTRVLPTEASSYGNTTLDTTDANGNQIIWYAQIVGDENSETIYIDPASNKLDITLPNYGENIGWYLNTVTGEVSINPPFVFKGKRYTSMSDVQSGGKSITGFDYANGVNIPSLSDGMIPVYYDSTAGSWKVADKTNGKANNTENWYDYTAGTNKWANVVTVDSSKLATYKACTPGDPVDEADIIGYFVWIPRYAYKLNTSKQEADIVFLQGTTDYYGEQGYAVRTIDNDGEYIVHPAFTVDTVNSGWSKEISGFWTAKFEASHSTTIDATTNIGNKYGSNGAGYVKVRPNVTSWRSIWITDIVTACTNMAGSHSLDDSNTHMMKNSEWGAVAYLTASKYGNNDIYPNSYTDGKGFYTTLTGMAGTSTSDLTETTFTAEPTINNSEKIVLNGKTYYRYNTAEGGKASTTGNIYGIYDMSGGAWEYVAAYVANGHAYLNTYGSAVVGAGTKYKNMYESALKDTDNVEAGLEWTSAMAQNNYTLAKAGSVKVTIDGSEATVTGTRRYGDAMTETSTAGMGASSWASDYSNFPNGSCPFIPRGGSFAIGTSAGVFAFHRSSGYGVAYFGFRPCVVAE